MYFKKKLSLISLSICCIGATSFLPLVTTSCGSDDPIDKYVYGSTFKIDSSTNFDKLITLAKAQINQDQTPTILTKDEFTTWSAKTEHSLVNSDFYWEMIIYQAQRVKDDKSKSFSIDKWDVDDNAPTGSRYQSVSITIDGNQQTNISCDKLSYDYNSEGKITCKSGSTIESFTSWKYKLVTVNVK